MGLQKLDDGQFTSKYHSENMRIFAQNFQLWVQCAKCYRHSRALKFFPKCFYTNSHTFQGAAQIFEKKTFFRYTLLYGHRISNLTITIAWRSNQLSYAAAYCRCHCSYCHLRNIPVCVCPPHCSSVCNKFFVRV